MGEGLKQMYNGNISTHQAEDDEELFDSASNSGDSDDDAAFSENEEASSPYKTSQLDSEGPLYELSTLMEQLPIKRGLSKYYQGKSQSFTSLCNARCIEDLPKKETNPYRERKMKESKSFAGGLDASQKQWYTPGQGISSQGSSRSCASLVARSSSNLPPMPVHKNLV